VPAFRVKFSANDLNCVDVPLNPTHSLTQLLKWRRQSKKDFWGVVVSLTIIRCKFAAQCPSERILEIGQHLMKMRELLF